MDRQTNVTEKTFPETLKTYVFVEYTIEVSLHHRIERLTILVVSRTIYLLHDLQTTKTTYRSPTLNL